MARSTTDPVSAEAYYRRALIEQPDGNGTTGEVELSLAELLLDGDRWDEAERQLDAWHARRSTAFNQALFRSAVLQARLAEHHGERAVLQAAAARALDLLVRGPALPRHPTVGLAETDAETEVWLRASAIG